MNNTYEYVKDDILTTTSFVEKLKAETQYADAGLFASPVFLRADNAGTYKAVIILFSIKKEDKKSMMSIEQLVYADIRDASDITHESARKHFDQMNIDIRTPILATRKGMNKELAKEYGAMVMPAMDRLRLHLFENGFLTKEEYMEYLKYALYSFSDEAAEAFSTVSRLFLYTNSATIKCRDCQRQYRISTKSYYDGQLMKSRCPNCQTINQNPCVKTGSVTTLRNEYMEQRIPKPSIEESSGEKDRDPITDKEGFTMDTRAILSKDAAISGQQLNTTTVTPQELEIAWDENTAAAERERIIRSDPEQTDSPKKQDSSLHNTLPEPVEEADPTAEEMLFQESETNPVEPVETKSLPETAAPPSFEDLTDKEQKPAKSSEKTQTPHSTPSLIGLGNARRIFDTIRRIKESACHPPLVFSLCGKPGNGILTSVLSLSGYERNEISIKKLSAVTREDFLSDNHCIVILLDKNVEAPSFLYQKLRNLDAASCVCFTGSKECLSDFRRNNPLMAGTILYQINYNEYAPEELYQIFRQQMQSYTLVCPDLSGEEVRDIFKGHNALTVKQGAGSIYFRHMLNKADKKELAKTELVKEFSGGMKKND